MLHWRPECKCAQKAFQMKRKPTDVEGGVNSGGYRRTKCALMSSFSIVESQDISGWLRKKQSFYSLSTNICWASNNRGRTKSSTPVKRLWSRGLLPKWTVTIPVTEHEDGIHPSQEGEMHVDTFYHPGFQSKSHHVGQILLKVGIEFTPYPFSMSFTFSFLFLRLFLFVRS